MSAPPLLQRIRTGLPPALNVAEIAELEHPDDPVARDTLARHIGRAVALGDLAAEQVMRTAWVWQDVEKNPPATGISLYNPLPHQRQQVTHIQRVWVIARSNYRRWRERCPPSLLTDTTLIDRWFPPEKTPRPTVPSRDIKARLQAGESIEAVHEATGASKHAIRAVKRANGIPDCPPGPKPR